MGQSDIARVRQHIAAEYLSAQLGLSGLAEGTSRHRFVPQIMPPVFRTGDLVALFLLNVFWVTNITPIAAGGPAGFLYWMALWGSLFHSLLHCPTTCATR